MRRLNTNRPWRASQNENLIRINTLQFRDSVKTFLTRLFSLRSHIVKLLVEMACPLRIAVVAVSALIALLSLYLTFWKSDELDKSEEGESDSECEEENEKPKVWRESQVLVDVAASISSHTLRCRFAVFVAGNIYMGASQELFST